MRAFYSLIITIVLMIVLGRLVWPTPEQAKAFSDAVRVLLRPIASTFLVYFNDPMTPILLSLALLATAFMVAVYIIVATESIGFRITEITKRILSVSRDSVSPPTDTYDATCQAITVIVQREPILEHAWNAYRAGVGNRRGVGIARPSEYLTLSTFDNTAIGLSMLNKIPGYFIAIGLILTFMGLVAGLYHASVGMRHSDIEAARESLVMLLNAASFKFTTSIAGLSSSLMTSIVYSLQRAKLDRAVDSLCFAIEGTIKTHAADEPTDKALTSIVVLLASIERTLLTLACPQETEKSSEARSKPVPG